MRRRSLVFASLALALAIGGYACGSGGSEPSGAGTGSGQGGQGAHAATSGSAGSPDAGDEGLFVDHGKVVSLVVAPGSTTIDVQNGAPAPTTFVATATFEDTTTSAVDAEWQFDHLELGQIDAVGVLTPGGKLGGKGTVTASYGGATATAAVTVVLHVTENPANLDPSQQALFDSPDANPSGTMLYPQDGTVFARGLLAPELMWSGGEAGDFYRVRLKQGFVEATLYASVDPPSAFLMPAALWTSLTQSNAGEPLEVDVARLSGGQAHQPMHETWTIAQGSLRGSIYYWAVNTGQLMKIAPGAAAPTVVFDSGPADQLGAPAPANYNGATPPWESGGNNKRCVACHTVSKDGSSIAAIFERTGSTASPWGTVDLTASPASVVQMTSYTSDSIYLGISPDGAHVVENTSNFLLRLANGKTGAPIASALDAFVDKVADPAFSPDGKLLAFSSNVTGAYPVEFTRADLDVMDFDPATSAFTNRRTIVNAGNQAIAFPSFTPDSKSVVFQSGDYSRAKYGTNQHGNDDLFIADLAGVVGSIRLDQASGVALDPRNHHISYQPTVNPISVGGYTWVVFVSPRDYGNKLLSTTDPTYENRKQLWVAAIDQNPQPGKDPSHPAFWLPGQDLTTTNMSGYWALEACHQTGTSCEEGFECCTGFCQADGMGGQSCVPPPGGCSKIGDKCATDGDCCNAPSAKCVGGFCAQGQPN